MQHLNTLKHSEITRKNTDLFVSTSDIKALINNSLYKIIIYLSEMSKDMFVCFRVFIVFIPLKLRFYLAG